MHLVLSVHASSIGWAHSKQSISNAVILWSVSFTPISKWRKRPWNLTNTKIPFKNVLSLTIESRMYLKFLQKRTSLPHGWFKTSQALWSSVDKARLNSSKDNFIGKALFCPKKGIWAFFLTFSFHLSFIGEFLILKCQTLVSKTTTWRTRASHFVDG